MLDLRNISLICVESRNPKLAKFSIDQCLRHANFGECILLTSKNFDLPNYINQILIPDIDSTRDYSHFMINEVHKYFDLDYVLIIQWDGFVLSSQCWRDEFFKFDYIGAPWIQRGIVGNGGFSLRSKKLCKILAGLKVKETHPEDLVICTVLRNDLENKYGLNFAPFDIAKLFAFESEKPGHNTFGFHAIQNFPLIFNDQEVMEIISLGEKEFVKSGHILKLIRASYKLNRFDLAEAVLKKRIEGNIGINLEGFILNMRIVIKKFMFRFRNFL